MKEDKDEVQPRVSFPEECPPFPRTPVSGLSAAATPSWLPSFQCVEQRSPRGSSPSRCVGQINSHCGRVTANKLIDSAHPEALDEIPQFWNVVRGDMSLIGPRPERPAFHEVFCQRIHGWEQRVMVKPGITGLAQVEGGYDLLPKEKAKVDVFYIEHRSLRLDWSIIWKTVRTMISGEGAR